MGLLASVRYFYVYGGDVCAECCAKVQAIIRDGQRVGITRARRADEAVGKCEHGCSPWQSHRYGHDGDMTLDDATFWRTA